MSWFLRTADGRKRGLVVAGPFQNPRRDHYFYEVTLEGHLNKSGAAGVDRNQGMELTEVYLRSWSERLDAHPVDEHDQPRSFSEIIKSADARRDA